MARALALLLVAAVPLSAESQMQESCIDCHSDPGFLVKNPRLYSYFQEWNSSVHRQVGVTCSKCHRGNPEAADQEAAHGGPLGSSGPDSAVNFRAIPETCGRCHSEVLENGYLQSAHFQKLAAQGKEDIGPNCVTCHGSMNIYVLNVTTVSESCAQCHNAETGSLPEVPEEARNILARFLSIHRYYRYVGIREDPLEAARFFKLVDPEIQEVIAAWHALDVTEVNRKMVVILELMKQKRDEIRRRSASEAPGAAQE
jgi:mono/diheme cytochrome c family protein